MIELDREVCGSLERAAAREWLETNGLGGFASSTVACLNTRRYHGLLVAATTPPTGRMVLLSKLEETLVVDGRRIELSTNRYPGVVHPEGFRHLQAFRLDPFPVFTYAAEGVELTKSICMIQGENSTVIRYKLRVPGGSESTDFADLKDWDTNCGHPTADRAEMKSVALEVRPLISFRDYHSLTHENDALDSRVRLEPGCAIVAPYAGLPELFTAHDGEAAEPTGLWYRSFEYDAERERGLDFQEDLFQPFVLRFDLSRRPHGSVIASTERRDATCAEEYQSAETIRRARRVASGSREPVVAALAAAADQFLVSRGSGMTVIAGYHWFTDWGRDTMIALPGLTLVTGRAEIARSILLEFARHVDQGMLPNRFPDAGEAPEYNTIDATLWYFQAVHALLRHTGDYEFVREHLYPVLTGILDWHVRGTRYGIRVRENGLLASAPEGAQLTWMDARVGERVITPRAGSPVEIQALWYNALRVMEDLAARFGEPEREWSCRRLAAAARTAFRRCFRNEEAGCLCDVVDGERRDPSIRPNQVLALSLPHTMLSREHAAQVLAVVERDLLTPYGLRTLAASDPRYAGRYAGGPAERDGVYHQGTVWPWLMGPFLTAYVRVHGRSRAARQQAGAWLRGFHERLEDAGLGHIAEVADGDPPHRPGGCIAQAWSVAELLRAALEDVWPELPVRARGR